VLTVTTINTLDVLVKREAKLFFFDDACLKRYLSTGTVVDT